MRPVIILYAKAPLPGSVKTRLLPAVSAEDAALLHTAFVWDTIETLQQLSDADIELHTDSPTTMWDAAGLVRRTQVRGSLELKLLHTLASALAIHERVFILGSDAPLLPLKHLEEMVKIDADVALGPSEDGGYWGIICRKIDARMFDGVEWSSGREFIQTEGACSAAGLRVATGPSWWDIDEPSDLQRLARSPHLPRHTKSALRAISIPAAMRQTGE